MFGSRPRHAAASVSPGRQNGSGYSSSVVTRSPAAVIVVMISPRVHWVSIAPWAGNESLTWVRAK
ncbi:MAG: hypothetical protein ACR2LI_17170 [Propionibacteriaceae bacterium]